tara:strand:- start:427 stop:726 length:300 start_codon:yes stop_codon:yes gene_type:complete
MDLDLDLEDHLVGATDLDTHILVHFMIRSMIHFSIHSLILTHVEVWLLDSVIVGVTEDSADLGVMEDLDMAGPTVITLDLEIPGLTMAFIIDTVMDILI